MSLPSIVFGPRPRRTAVRAGILIIVAFVTLRWILIPIRTDGISMRPTYEPGRLVGRVYMPPNDHGLPPTRGREDPERME